MTNTTECKHSFQFLGYVNGSTLRKICLDCRMTIKEISFKVDT